MNLHGSNHCPRNARLIRHFALQTHLKPLNHSYLNGYVVHSTTNYGRGSKSRYYLPILAILVFMHMGADFYLKSLGLRPRSKGVYEVKCQENRIFSLSNSFRSSPLWNRTLENIR
jgi:hypothetical protein